MATLATTEELAEARREVTEQEATVTDTRYMLCYATEDAEIDSLAARLTDAHRRLRMARSILGDMEAGAGDFHDWDAEPDTGD